MDEDNRAFGEFRFGGGSESPGMMASKEAMGGTPTPIEGLACGRGSVDEPLGGSVGESPASSGRVVVVVVGGCGGSGKPEVDARGADEDEERLRLKSD